MSDRALLADLQGQVTIWYGRLFVPRPTAQAKVSPGTADRACLPAVAYLEGIITRISPVRPQAVWLRMLTDWSQTSASGIGCSAHIYTVHV